MMDEEIPIEIDAASTSRGTTTSGRDAGDDEHESEQGIRDAFIRKEERHVMKAKVLVAGAILACAVAVTTSVYIFAKQNDENRFEAEYKGFVKHINELVQWEVVYNFALMQQLSASVTTAANVTNAKFPFVTVPAFELSAGAVDGMGGIMLAGLAPIVESRDKEAWEKYSVDHKGWFNESSYIRAVNQGLYRDALHGTIQDHEHDRRLQATKSLISDKIWHWEKGEEVPYNPSEGEIMAPLWQISPAAAPPINGNLLSDERISVLYNAMKEIRGSVLSPAYDIEDLFDFAFDEVEKPRKAFPHAFLLEPVFATYEADSDSVAFLIGLTSFGNLVDKMLPEDIHGIIAVIKDSCGLDITFELHGQKSTFLGYEDLHDPQFEKYEHSTTLEPYSKLVNGLCQHEIYLYPSSAFRSSYETNRPFIFTILVATAFATTLLLMILYDVTVNRRQEKTMKIALRSNAVVSSLFPQAVRDRIMNDAEQNENIDGRRSNKEGVEENDLDNRPIADFYPSVTVLFADIAGFTAWSSTREPFQVFTLLENLFSRFDSIAKRRKIFKVETVGDCYVAVAGLPKPLPTHASTMCRFAKDCQAAFREAVWKLQVTLGPDTADLALRIGIHSGAVTAGVLRGENARFQLFGDTMNTTARMESTCARGRIQLSAETADLLKKSHKEHWIAPREDRVKAKGKGELSTFWLIIDKPNGENGSCALSITSDDESTDTNSSSEGDGAFSNDFVTSPARYLLSKRDRRLVDWNASLLQGRLSKVLEQRGKDSSLDTSVKKQISHLVTEIATRYNNSNRFHCFEHASHVTQSVTKLLGRIEKASKAKELGRTSERPNDDHSFMKDITSNELTKFAVVLCALIHDVEHQGVPNSVLIEEKSPLAAKYDRSIAENNSVDVAWQILMEDKYSDLRNCIGETQEEVEQFGQLLKDAVLATDVMDKELKAARDARWAAVFSEANPHNSKTDHDRAVIVLEHLIQASDVAHTMQHWHIFRRWNERLFCEMYQAYKDGRTNKDPAEFWYEGEKGFLDFYVIPLARKLKECAVFGVSSDEYLNYAMENRKEWEVKGRQAVAEMVEKYCDTIQATPRFEELEEEMGGLERRIQDRLFR